jgi:probable rRNA maturation factor
MIKVYVKKQSNYPFDTPKLKKKLKSFLKKEGIVSDSVVNIAVVGETKMKDISRKYLNERNEVHNVLSFVEEELTEEFVYPPTNDYLRLGEIILCYPKVFEEAKKEGKRIDDKVYELVEHGAQHLLGRHHK